MIPLYTNPHFLPHNTGTITRAELSASCNGDNEAGDFESQDEAISSLNEVLARIVAPDGITYKQRRRETDVYDSGGNYELGGPVLFRLLSSSRSPRPISLLPPPAAPSISREPYVEDTEEQAIRRKQLSEAAVIDTETIISNSKHAQASGYKPSVEIRVATSGPVPLSRLMIVQTLQQPRKTRPPVPYSMLVHYPYGSHTSLVSVQHSKAKSMDCPIVDASMVSKESRKRKRKRNRSNGIPTQKRPVPRFWRPVPAWKGKCMGYGYGYPTTANLQGHYIRDKMKKAVYIES